MIIDNQRNAITYHAQEQKITVDESLLDIHRKLKLDLPDWQPTTELKEYKQATKLYIDIETVGGLDPYSGTIISVGFLFDVDDKISQLIITEKNERLLLARTLRVLRDTNADILIGHNIFNFDFNYLAVRCDHYGLKHEFIKRDRITKVTASSFNGKPLEVMLWDVYGLNAIDTFICACIYDKSAAVLPNYRLKDVAIALGVRDKKRLELDFKEIEKYWENDDVEPIEEYLAYDLIDTKGLADNFIPVVWYQQKIVPNISLQNLAVASPALKWQKIAQSFYPSSYQPTADDKFKYDGALTDCNPGLYKNAYKIDVSSMYPSIMMRYELNTEKDTDNHLLRVLKYLFAERFNLKKQYKETKNSIYDQQQGALKILLNSFYGFTGVGGYSFNDMEIAALVTAYGRKILKLMCCSLQRAGATIIETDTDGIICYNGDPQQAIAFVREDLPDGIGVDLDFENTHVYVPKRKSYLLFSDFPHGKTKKVGLFRKRNRIPLENSFTLDFVKLYLEDPSLAKHFYIETAHWLITGNMDLEHLTITQKIPKNDKILTTNGIGNHGDRVSYYYGELKRYHKKNGKPLKSHKRPVTEGNYWIEFYLDKLNKTYSEIIQTIEKVTPQTVDFDREKISEQLAIFL